LKLGSSARLLLVEGLGPWSRPYLRAGRLLYVQGHAFCAHRLGIQMFREIHTPVIWWIM